jgi:hypothetical protein
MSGPSQTGRNHSYALDCFATLAMTGDTPMLFYVCIILLFPKNCNNIRVRFK